ncbi:MAG: glycerol-3-phosphate dehydrogenase/oxidase [Pseudomonadota bacterium]|nr:glycerol-3-phosphate dehydrogenase/oxidase [Pseudomonadota bacterium]
MRVAIVGGGINGICSAWALARRGHQVDLFESGQLVRATSSASSKLLHGGLRYLEHGEFRLVREALRERRWWIDRAPHLARRLTLLLPIYRHSRRPRWLVKMGLATYDLLAGRSGLGRHRWLSLAELEQTSPELRQEGLLGAYRFFDGQMDDLRLGLWAAEQARNAGVTIHEHCRILKVTTRGGLRHQNGEVEYDRIVNVAGPWAESLLNESGIDHRFKLDLVRGSHLLIEGRLDNGFLLETGVDQRIFFVLPYGEQTLIGTTEVRQSLDDPIVCSAAEQDYLLTAYNRYFSRPIKADDIVRTFAGVRPLIHSADDPSSVSREYRITRNGRLVTVYGGKWTTARALGEQVANVSERP